MCVCLLCKYKLKKLGDGSKKLSTFKKLRICVRDSIEMRNEIFIQENFDHKKQVEKFDSFNYTFLSLSLIDTRKCLVLRSLIFLKIWQEDFCFQFWLLGFFEELMLRCTSFIESAFRGRITLFWRAIENFWWLIHPF